MQKTVNFGRKARILALCGAAFFVTAANAQNTVITADKSLAAHFDLVQHVGIV